MKVIVAFSLIAFLAISAESAQPGNRHTDKHSNLSVLLAYRPNSEVHMKDKTNNKSWTYKIEDESSEVVNEELLEALIKEKFARRFSPNEIDERRTVKRENANASDWPESNESPETDDTPAQVVEAVDVDEKDEKKICYKSTYDKVLKAFQKSLKNQIEEYKKCVCDKKKPTTTTAAPTTTTTEEASIVIHGRNMPNQQDDRMNANNEDELQKAINNSSDFVCIHSQYAFMLKELLKKLPCNNTAPQPSRNEFDEFNGGDVRREGRNNKIEQELDESESVEIDISEVTQKPKSSVKSSVKSSPKTSPKSSSKSSPKSSPKSSTKASPEPTDDEEILNEKIMAVLKDHMKSKKLQSQRAKKQTSPKKITIRPREVAQEESDENVTAEESEEFTQKHFIKKLSELFNQYQIESDETFPMQSGEYSAESTSSLPPRKSSKRPPVKSAAVSTVSEDSDESYEAVIKRKTRADEKMRHQLKESSRKDAKVRTAATSTITTSRSTSSRSDASPSSSRSAASRSASSSNRSTVGTSAHNRLDAPTTKKSYRSTPRTDEAADNSVEAQHVPRSHHAKKPQRKNSRTSADDRLAADLAKKISDFARGKKLE